MIVIGVTGAVASGKSRAATVLRRLGAFVHDSDQAVREAYAHPMVREQLVRRWPDAVIDKRVDRSALAHRIVDDPEMLRELEVIVHPVVRANLLIKMQVCLRNKRRCFVIDSPLLFESGLAVLCDYILLLTAPAAVRRARVARRSSHAVKLFDLFESRHIAQDHKRCWADWVIPSHGQPGETARKIRAKAQAWLRPKSTSWPPSQGIPDV